MIRDSRPCFAWVLCVLRLLGVDLSVSCTQEGLYQAGFESCLIPRMPSPGSFSSLMPDDGALGTGKEIRTERRLSQKPGQVGNRGLGAFCS